MAWYLWLMIVIIIAAIIWPINLIRSRKASRGV